MDKILDIINKNYEVPQDAKKHLVALLQNIEGKQDKIDFILNKLINFKLDLNSVLGYLCFECNTFFDEFGDDVNEIYKNLVGNKFLTEYSEFSSQEEQAEMLRKMFIVMSNDIRVIIVKLCIIAYQAKNCTMPLTKQQKAYLVDVREIFAPLAERLGLNSLKSELEDICLKFLNPKIYEYLENSVMLKKEENQHQIDITRQKLQTIVEELGIKKPVIMARQKHFSSIYKKIKSNNVSLANIYDLIAMRVIVNTVEECYAVLGKIHGVYKPMAGRFKDYIASPKPNGYQSLHTTIIAENNRPLEIQIRTVKMHKNSEYGVLVAHWIYKEKRTKTTSLDRKLSWLREIMDSAKDLSTDEFISTLKTNLCEGQTYVQTPKGKVIEFPEGATLIDFAYAIHSDIGNACVGGKVNGVIKPLSTVMKNGDVVEIITSQNSKGPSRDWLKIAKTASAKSKINAFFKKELKEDNIKTGKNMLELALKNKGYVVAKVLTEKYINVLLEKYAFNSLDELLAGIGYGNVPLNQVVNRLTAVYDQDNIILPTINDEGVLKIKTNKEGILVDGDSGMLIRYAGCCSPILGEEIVGYISRGRGVTIHRHDCKNLKYFEAERLISAEWIGKDNSVSVVTIKIISLKSDTFLYKLTQELSINKVKILSIESKNTINERFNTTLKIEVNNKKDLNKIINSIKQIKCVEEVYY